MRAGSLRLRLLAGTLAWMLLAIAVVGWGLRALFQLADAEQALCFISIGTVQSRKSVRARPAVHSYVSTLDVQRGVVPGL